ncbi:alcohol dehydrogenase, propanol-preferring [Fodinibius salinus]|uniref:alcohol dehydrogenase n=1 Tax=Fodinibius salinus TaxID=860790 RepID=A0A5D3YPE1_9BACT|nr:zinc-dependent alcohol dehydrogenase family protein [Fodinibius salinus]TYP94039.1 alcohol dehydrogenase, propanol-preferring [Fodinibius salinus]
MQAMLLEEQGDPLQPTTLPKPSPGDQQVRIKVEVCGVCRTDLHILDGDLNQPNLPLIPGHQIVGTVDKVGTNTSNFTVGDKVGVPWLGYTCQQCEFCSSGKENLCNNAEFTGYTQNGGFAEYAVADSRFCFPIPDHYPATQAAPLLCAGLIGYRSLRKTDNAHTLGFYGFGSAAHILIQVASHQNKEVLAFTRPGDDETQQFARSLGASWAGSSETMPPKKLDAAIIFAPVGKLVPQALKSIKKGGKVICAGIHMSDIPSFPYGDLWEERSIESVANLTRQDGIDFMQLAPKIPVRSHVTTYPLSDANRALNNLRNGDFDGSAVLEVSSEGINDH